MKLNLNLLMKRQEQIYEMITVFNYGTIYILSSIIFSILSNIVIGYGFYLALQRYFFIFDELPSSFSIIIILCASCIFVVFINLKFMDKLIHLVAKKCNLSNRDIGNLSIIDINSFRDANSFIHILKMVIITMSIFLWLFFSLFII